MPIITQALRRVAVKNPVGIFRSTPCRPTQRLEKELELARGKKSNWRIFVLFASCGFALSAGSVVGDSARQPSLKVAMGGMKSGGAISTEFASFVPAKVAFGPKKSPAIRWSKGPEGINAYALIPHDPDTPSGADDVNHESRTSAATLRRVTFAVSGGPEAVAKKWTRVLAEGEPPEICILNRAVAKGISTVAQGQQGTLSGWVSIGPLCPIEPCPYPKPDVYSSRELILQPEGGTAIRIKLNSDGTFWAQVNAGTYRVDLTDCIFPGCKDALPQTVMIKPSETTTLNLSIDTGMR